MRRIAVVLVLCTAPFVVTAAGATPPCATSPSIEAVYPNPVVDGDEGEFVVVSVPAGYPSDEYGLTDGETTVTLGAAREGRVAVANHPRARNLTDLPVIVDGSLSLANAGERVRLVSGDAVVAERRYRDAAAGELGRWNGTRVAWRPLGATDRSVVRGGPAEVRAFVLPDAPGVAVDVLAAADRRILLAGYTLTSERVVDRLTGAHRDGVAVRVLLEGDPVGGITARQARLLDRLAGAGVSVRVLGGPHERYAYHHAKYAVVDDRAVLLTENWKPAGTGGHSSRGWGVVTNQPRVVRALAETFRADAGWLDARAWESVRAGRQFTPGEPATRTFEGSVEPERVRVERTDLALAPEAAGGHVRRTIARADASVDVVGVSLGSWDEPILVALRRAARRGVTVRILLSDAWYVREDNRRQATRFAEWADDRDLPLTVKLADPGDRFGKIHAKGAVIDDERVVLGSLNWNERAATVNRETVLVLHGREVAAYYGRVFDRDWRGPRPTLPVGVLGSIVGGVVLVGLVARGLEFEA